MDTDFSQLKFNDLGLIPAIAQDYKSGQVLMMAWMNRQAILVTLETKRVTYWSRSRQELWIKGATSTHTQKLIEMRADCDHDCLLVIVEQTGPACHMGKKSCFFRKMEISDETEISA